MKTVAYYNPAKDEVTYVTEEQHAKNMAAFERFKIALPSALRANGWNVSLAEDSD